AWLDDAARALVRAGAFGSAWSPTFWFERKPRCSRHGPAPVTSFAFGRRSQRTPLTFSCCCTLQWRGEKTESVSGLAMGHYALGRVGCVRPGLSISVSPLPAFKTLLVVSGAPWRCVGPVCRFLLAPAAT